MRWSVVRLISVREIRDQFRDRRTLFLILGLPVLMYPLFVGVGVFFVAAIKEKKLVVGVVGGEHLPQPQPDASPSVAAIAGGPAAFAYHQSREFPPLIVDGKFPERYLTDDPEGPRLQVKPLKTAYGCDLLLTSAVKDVGTIQTEGKNLLIVATIGSAIHFRIFDSKGKIVVDTDETRLPTKAAEIAALKKQLESLWLLPQLTEEDKNRLIPAITSIVGYTLADEAVLAARQADALLVIDPDLLAKLERGERPTIRVLEREGEENSKLAVRRLLGVLRKWVEGVKAARFARKGLAPDFDSPIEIQDPLSVKPPGTKVFDELRDVLVKIIPFLLMMWMLTGAIYPAIDMTAGEKERGTMETLLISPAERSEIVMGKFTAVVTMGFGTALWNVFLMLIAVAIAPLLSPTIRGHSLLSLPGLGACVLAALPIAMLIAASGLALGVFARSTKEGNYYVVPMFFVALPLAYLSMSPGIELDSRTSWIPVTNALLLQQRLMAVRTDPFPWIHIPAVVISLSFCILAALWAAVRQFHRESVLFREVESGGSKWSLFGKGRGRGEWKGKSGQ